MNYREIERYYETLREQDAARVRFYRDIAEKDGTCKAFLSQEKQALWEKARAEWEGDENKRSAAERKLAAAREGKLKRLASLGLKESDLAPSYHCEKCKDTGYVGTKPCTCFYETRKKLLVASGVTTGFPAFSALDPTGKSFGENYAMATVFAERFPKTRYDTLVFTGKTGTGKTCLMQATLKALEERGFSVLYFTALELGNAFLDYHTQKVANRADFMNRLLLSDVLAIDDLGIEPILRNVTKEYLLGVLSTRTLKNKHTIITTNLSPEGVLERYGERIFSRLADKEHSRWLQFSDEKDLRLYRPQK